MGPTLSPYVTRASRFIRLNADDTVLTVDDELMVAPGEDHILKWNMITRAIPTIESPKSILLSKKGHTMRLEVLSPEPVTVMVDAASSENVYDLPNYGASCVGFIAKLPAGAHYEIKVKLSTLQ